MTDNLPEEDFTTEDDVFAPESEAEQQEENEQSAEVEQKAEQEGEEIAEPPAAETEESEKEEKSVPLEALKDERTKRQKLEDENRQLKEQLTQNKQRSNIPDPETEPDKYKQYFEDQAELERLEERITLSRDIMIDSVDDYEQMEAIFNEAAKKDILIAQKMTAAKNPAKFVYDYGKKTIAAKQSEKEALKAEIRAELLKEMAESPSEKKRLKVPNLTTSTAKGSNSVPLMELNEDGLFSNSVF